MESVVLAEPQRPARRTRRLRLQRQVGLTTAFWLSLGALCVFVLATAHPQYPESAVGAALIIATAWLPAFIWIRKDMGGLPIFPVFAVTYTWTFGLPLLYEHPIVKFFDAFDQIYAAFSVTGFLLLATAVWYGFHIRTARRPRHCLSIRLSAADAIFFFTLILSILFAIAVNGAWIRVPTGVFSIVQAVMLAIQALCCFVLSYRLGAGQLQGWKGLTFKVLLVVLVLATLPSLLMINSMAIVALAGLGYVSGSGKVPWISFSVAILLFGFLHLGKADMREKYWSDVEEGPIQPSAYPAFVAEWISTSIEEFRAGREHEEDERKSLLERASLMQLLLYEQAMSSQLPFLYGDTYVIVPQLLIPRIFYPSKPTTHEGTYRLNIHYGFQTREQTELTTIGFGLLNEAYANFGLAGMAMFAIASGAFYGWVERFSSAAPLLSFRGLFAIIVASYSFQTEFAAGVYVAALFQSTIVLTALSVVTMRPRLNPLAVGAAAPISLTREATA